MTAVSPPSDVPLRIALGGSPGRRRRERVVRGVFLASALASVLVSLFIVWTVAFRAVEFLTIVPLDKLWTTGWFPRRGLFDIPTLVLGTLMVTLVAMIVAAPIGLASAIYLAEYSSRRVRRVVKPVLEVLAGIPSVVLGFFAITVLNPELVRLIFPSAPGFNLLVAGLGVGILTVPLIASIAEDALRAVPASLREASYGLGARRITTTLRVVFPAAVSGVVAALILATSRAVGETMVVALAGGATAGGLRSLDVLKPGQTMTGAMASLATGSDNVVGARGVFESLYFVGFLLFALTLVLNSLGDLFVRRTRQRY